MLGEVRELRWEFERGLVGDVFGGPDLAVRVWVAGAHHRAAILEDLDVLDLGHGAEFCGLLEPTPRRRVRMSASSMLARVRSWRG